MFYYFAYELLIQSEFLIPEMMSFDGEVRRAPDVVIRIGSVPTTLENPTGEGVLYQIAGEQCLVRLDTVARYLIQNGNEIIIQPIPDAPGKDVRVFLLGACMGALLHQRGVLAFHAATLATERGAVLFTAPSGFGKSTLLNAMLLRGYKMLADDVTGIVLDASGKPMVLPAFPRTKIWADAATILKIDTDKLQPVRVGMKKYGRHVPDQFHTKPLPIHRIYRLLINNQDELSVQPLQSIYNFQNVLKNTYRELFLDGFEMRPAHFKLVSAVARHTTMHLVTQPAGQYRIHEWADMVEADFLV